MNIYVIDHRGPSAAREVTNKLCAHELIGTNISDRFHSTALPDVYHFPALFFIHADDDTRLALETELNTEHVDQQWALIHFYRTAITYTQTLLPKVCQTPFPVEKLLGLGTQWLLKLRASTLTGIPDFGEPPAKLPTVAIAALLMQKADLPLTLVPGLRENVIQECPDGQYERDINNYFKSVR